MPKCRNVVANIPFQELFRFVSEKDARELTKARNRQKDRKGQKKNDRGRRRNEYSDSEEDSDGVSEGEYQVNYEEDTPEEKRQEHNEEDKPKGKRRNDHANEDRSKPHDRKKHQEREVPSGSEGKDRELSTTLRITSRQGKCSGEQTEAMKTFRVEPGKDIKLTLQFEVVKANKSKR